MPDVKGGGKDIAEHGCDRGTCHIPSKAEDHDRVQHDVDQVAYDHAHHGSLRIAFCTDDIAEAVADN